MTYAICPVGAAPIRNTSSHKSEMLSQLLFGELVEVLELKGRQWVKVRCCEDNFVGWMSSTQLEIITPAEYDNYQNNFAFVFDFFQAASAQKDFLPLMIGTRLPDFDGMQFSIREDRYTFSGQAVYPQDVKSNVEVLIKLARKYINVPFLWGGRSAMGIDAAGFVQVVCRMCGVQLPREVDEQVYAGENIAFVDRALPGDIAFFENKRGRIVHVGFVIKDKEIIHSYGKVRIDKIDHYGIFNNQLKRYTHKLRLVKRIFAHEPPSLAPSLTAENGVEMSQMEMF